MLFSIVVAPVYIPSSCVLRFPFLHILANIWYLCGFFDDSHSDRYEVISHCRFDLCFPGAQQCLFMQKRNRFTGEAENKLVVTSGRGKVLQGIKRHRGVSLLVMFLVNSFGRPHSNQRFFLGYCEFVKESVSFYWQSIYCWESISSSIGSVFSTLWLKETPFFFFKGNSFIYYNLTSKVTDSNFCCIVCVFCIP